MARADFTQKHLYTTEALQWEWVGLKKYLSFWYLISVRFHSTRVLYFKEYFPCQFYYVFSGMVSMCAGCDVYPIWACLIISAIGGKINLFHLQRTVYLSSQGG